MVQQTVLGAIKRKRKFSCHVANIKGGKYVLIKKYHLIIRKIAEKRRI